MWSGVAVDDSLVSVLPGGSLQRLLTQMPNFALALIDGLVAKGKCYSSMAQMLGTRSVIERLAQYLLESSGELYGVPDGDRDQTQGHARPDCRHDGIDPAVGNVDAVSGFTPNVSSRWTGCGIRIERVDLLKDPVQRLGRWPLSRGSLPAIRN